MTTRFEQRGRGIENTAASIGGGRKMVDVGQT